MIIGGRSLKEGFHKESLVNQGDKASRGISAPGQEVASLLEAYTGGRQKSASTSGRKEDGRKQRTLLHSERCGEEIRSA